VSGETPPRAQGFAPGRHAIEAYGAGGFRFAGMSHRGSILALPSGIHAWAARVPADIEERGLRPVFDDAKLIDLLLVGTGMDLVPLPAPLQRRLREAGLRAEPMATAAAARTYNVLLEENRRVAAALLAVD
jgi:uncharacterized protein